MRSLKQKRTRHGLVPRLTIEAIWLARGYGHPGLKVFNFSVDGDSSTNPPAEMFLCFSEMYIDSD